MHDLNTITTKEASKARMAASREAARALRDSRDLYWRHRRDVPAFRALIRAMEARLYAEFGPLPRPVLDLGCGDGRFAAAVWGRLETGVDADEKMLAEARACGAYDTTVCADAAYLPFPAAAFGAVISNSVLEHLPCLEPVLSEIHRVLRPGGRLIITAPTDRLNAGLAGFRILKSLGAMRRARCYQAWFTRFQRHCHLDSPEAWQRRIEVAGLRVTQRTGYFSPDACGWFDLLHVWGAPDWLSRRLLGRWVLWPWRPLFYWEERLLARFIGESEPLDAGCCFIAAEKT